MRWKTFFNLTVFLVPAAVMLAEAKLDAAVTYAALGATANLDAAVPDASVPIAAAATPSTDAQSAAPIPQSAAGPLDIRGAWKPETYRLKSGPVHEVTGLISFTEKDWSVLFFIVTDEGPRRGSGEGGTYTLEGDKLTFRHLYNLSGGHAVDGFEASELSMRVRPPDAEDAPAEPCTITIEDDLLTIFFPSGNQMTFRRSSR